MISSHLVGRVTRYLFLGEMAGTWWNNEGARKLDRMPLLLKKSIYNQIMQVTHLDLNPLDKDTGTQEKGLNLLNLESRITGAQR